MGIEIREHRPGESVDGFIRFHHELYRDDPAFVPPLEMDLKKRLDAKKNPFFEHAEAIYFTAHRDGRIVGRCSAQIDREHLRIHGDGAGFFGFFDTIEDQEVASALLERAESWLREKGMKRIRGPFSLNINEECGQLVEGFEHPPVILMPHGMPYQGELIEGAGYHKIKDLLAWRYTVEQPPERAKKAWAAIDALPELRFRSVNPRNMRAEVDTLLDIFNETWRDNWGFVPATEAEAAQMAEDMGLIIDPDLAFFAEIQGRAVGCCVALPNVNEAARDLEGKLFPFGIFKLLWRLKVRKPKSARLMILGIRPEVQRKKRYAGLSTAIYAELARRGIEKGYEWAELGWTLEDNELINLGIKGMRAEVYKRYRLYEKSLEGQAREAAE